MPYSLVDMVAQMVTQLRFQIAARTGVRISSDAILAWKFDINPQLHFNPMRSRRVIACMILLRRGGGICPGFQV